MSDLRGNKGLGLSGQLKQKLIQQALQRKLQQGERAAAQPITPTSRAVDEKLCRFDQLPGYLQLKLLHRGGEQLGVTSPFFRVHQGVAGATTQIGERQMVNYASYNYLGFSGDARVNQAAKEAVDRYGTSVSASRPVAGERPIHRELEQTLAELYEVDDAVVFVSGHATNVSTIGHLFGSRDLILHDELVHNSALVGAQLSGAKRRAFPHNDLAALEALLQQLRGQFERVLIVVEGLYSMDGDYPDLPRLVELKQRFGCFLMVDEAHSLGVMGKSGLGIREHFGVAGRAVDIWMGTLSKTLAGCGGYIAGESALVEHLKFLAPGFLYSVGIPAQVAAPALKALQLMLDEPERVTQLQQRCEYFCATARQAGFDVGDARGLAVIPIITGSSLKAAQLSERLLEEGINVQPILYPAVPESSARLRFFITCEHTEAQIDATLLSLQQRWDS
ncbi:MAG TPA: aminotransferase class I/II-fold pyridoxal phosphate-dependent enzyme [Motiliproteus sp.]